MKTAKAWIVELILGDNKSVPAGYITYDEAIKAMREYAAAACKEQREICAKKYLNSDELDADIILNAPQPQLL